MPLQNHSTDGERGGLSWCASCSSALGFLAAAATWLSVVGSRLRRLSLEFLQLVVMVGNRGFPLAGC